MNVAIKSAAEVTEEEQARQQDREANVQVQPLVVDRLASYIRDRWELAKRHKMDVTERLHDCLRRRKGEYSPDKLAQIQQTGGAEIYMQLTGAKVTAAKAWLSDLFSTAGEKPWTLEPTPVPELPPHLAKRLVSEAVEGAMQMGVPPELVRQLVMKHKDRLLDELDTEAKERAEKMADHIEDVMTEGGWRDEFDSFLDDLVTFPAAVFKGPIYRHRKQLKWQDIGTGEYVPQLRNALTREFRRVSPYDAFPAPGCADPQDGWFIEHQRLTRDELTAMRDAPGYNPEAIAHVLREYAMGGNQEWLFEDVERAQLESGGRHTPTATETGLIDAIEFSGHIQGQMLLDWGMDPAGIHDPLTEYPVSCIVIGRYCVRALLNPDPTGKSDYYKASWRSVPGSFWGSALPEELSDCQDICNAAVRSLVNNMAMSSGPQVAVDHAYAASGQDYTKVYPWKIWAYDSTGTQASTRQPVTFFQPNSNTQELLAIYERFSNYADQVSGLPSYAYGSDQGAGAAKTASGLSMLMNAASKSVKQVVRCVDINVIEPCVSKLYLHAMLDPETPQEARGDLKVKARGSDSLVHKEAQQQRLLELMQVTGNPVDMQILGLEGRRQMLEETFQSIEAKRPIVPTLDEFNQRMEQQQLAQSEPQPDPGNGPAQPQP